MHIHSNLNVTVNGKSLIALNGIGINSTSWNDHSLDKFGTELKTTIFGMITPVMSPLHTHDSSGTIHAKNLYNCFNKTESNLYKQIAFLTFKFYLLAWVCFFFQLNLGKPTSYICISKFDSSYDIFRLRPVRFSYQLR